MTRSLVPFALEQCFSEFEFVSGMRHLAANGAYSPTTREVLIIPGSLFGWAYADYVRIGFGGDAGIFVDGLTTLEAVLTKGNNA